MYNCRLGLIAFTLSGLHVITVGDQRYQPRLKNSVHTLTGRTPGRSSCIKKEIATSKVLNGEQQQTGHYVLPQRTLASSSRGALIKQTWNIKQGPIGRASILIRTARWAQKWRPMKLQGTTTQLAGASLTAGSTHIRAATPHTKTVIRRTQAARTPGGFGPEQCTATAGPSRNETAHTAAAHDTFAPAAWNARQVVETANCSTWVSAPHTGGQSGRAERMKHPASTDGYAEEFWPVCCSATIRTTEQEQMLLCSRHAQVNNTTDAYNM